jgi:hypothetical protein
MKARVNLTPEMMEKLINKQTVYFKVPSGCNTLELRLLEDEDSFSQFDRLFGRVWKSLSTQFEKLIK